MKRSESLEGRGEGVRSIKERSDEVREGNRENNEEKGEERVKGTGVAMVKGGLREGGYGNAMRRMGQKRLVERLETARLENKRERLAAREPKKEEQESMEKKKERGKCTRWGRGRKRKRSRRSGKTTKKKVEMERMRCWGR